MKKLVILAHPNNSSLCGVIKDSLVEIFAEKKYLYKAINLYEENFDPILSLQDFVTINQGLVLKDVDKYQKLISEYRDVIFIFPLWWCTFPALLKGFIDRIFAYNWAYTSENNAPKGLLKGYRFDIIYTTGSTKKLYKQNGLSKSIETMLGTGLFTFCDAQLKKIFVVDNVINLDNAAIKVKLAKIFDYYKNET